MKPSAYIVFDRDAKIESIFLQKNKPLTDHHKNIPLYAIPKGFKLVPLEPTECMKKGNDWMDVNVYKLFVNNAPKIEDI